MRLLVCAVAALAASLLLLLPVPSIGNDRFSSGTYRRRRKPLENYQKLSSSSNGGTKNDRFSIANMTCDFYEQPLNHFDLPRGRSSTYLQRYCIYNGFIQNSFKAPVFFYTGNESPLEEYINNTGLMWELAEEFGAQIVFVEHRYEGESLPLPNISNCMAYSSSVQALADYANFIERKLFQANNGTLGTLQRRPVIAFGGSYGGMLSAWLRMKYPNIVAGAIAGSAPIWGFPRNFPSKIDAAFQVIKRGLQYSYPPTKPHCDDNHCASNLLAAWPLIQVLGKDSKGRQVLTKSFRLCEPLQENADVLIEWAQSPWFDLAEGSFPYPSSYITYALLHQEVKLPAWPLQAACWNVSRLHKDFGIHFEGNISDVNYNISYGDTGLRIVIDWDKAVPINLGNLDSASITGLLESVRDAVSIWFNVTKDVKCYNLTVSPSNESFQSKDSQEKSVEIRPLRGAVVDARRRMQSGNSTAMCWDMISTSGSWPALCCNEEMNLIITEASGLGRDFLWPPSHPRGTSTHADVIDPLSNATDPFCADPEGIYGFPQDPPDPWSTWMDTIYGGTRIDSHSNIVFSNGLLDPWSAAGVYDSAMDPTGNFQSNTAGVPGLYVQNISGSDSMIALIMEYGGHHTDLMYSNPADPPCISEARKIEKRYIARWIQEFWKISETRQVE